MPVRVTETVDHARAISKGTRGALTGWELQPLDAGRARGCLEADIVRPLMPKYLYVRINGAGWTVHPQLGKCVYALPPRYRVLVSYRGRIQYVCSYAHRARTCNEQS